MRRKLSTWAIRVESMPERRAGIGSNMCVVVMYVIMSTTTVLLGMEVADLVAVLVLVVMMMLGTHGAGPWSGRRVPLVLGWDLLLPCWCCCCCCWLLFLVRGDESEVEVEVEVEDENFLREARRLGLLDLETRYGEEEEEELRDAVMLRGMAFKMVFLSRIRFLYHFILKY